ncbi:MAG: hypothetical protein JKY29_03595 [Gammaproteobacteria bacterium]|nr:hypothetical protein [Gammaproteobacteria bacterium]
MEVSNNCAWCDHPKDAGPICSKCGADYAKAEAIKQHGKADSEAISTLDNGFTMEAVDTAAAIEDPILEKKICLAALPSMLAFAFLVQLSGVGTSIQRIAFTMPVHEFGHATVAWFCGFNAVPTLWKTISPSDRGIAASFVLFIGIVSLANYGRRHMLGGWVLIAVFLLLMQGIGTLMITERDSQQYILFGGDGGGMVLATLLMLSFYFGKETQLYKGGLRWGFLAIGAAAFADMFMTWLRSASDRLQVPYGLTGGEPTDAFKLINYHTWSWEQLISRHVTVGVICLMVLLAFYLWGIKQASVMIVTKQREDAQTLLAAADDPASAAATLNQGRPNSDSHSA